MAKYAISLSVLLTSYSPIPIPLLFTHILIYMQILLVRIISSMYFLILFMLIHPILFTILNPLYILYSITILFTSLQFLTITQI